MEVALALLVGVVLGWILGDHPNKDDWKFA